jgi:hypothetical protein
MRADESLRPAVVSDGTPVTTYGALVSNASGRHGRKSTDSSRTILTRALLASVGVVAGVSVVAASRARFARAADVESARSGGSLGYYFGPGTLWNQPFFSDNGVPEGQCDQDQCPGVAYVSNCINGGAGCQGVHTGCRLCSVEPTGVGVPPNYYPACPCCVCEEFDLPLEKCSGPLGPCNSPPPPNPSPPPPNPNPPPAATPTTATPSTPSTPTTATPSTPSTPAPATPSPSTTPASEEEALPEESPEESPSTPDALEPAAGPEASESDAPAPSPEYIPNDFEDTPLVEEEVAAEPEETYVESTVANLRLRATPGGLDTTETLKFSGAISHPDGSKVYLVPHDYTSVGVFDVASESMTTLDLPVREHDDGLYRGGALATNGKIYMTPDAEKTVAVMDTADESFSFIPVTGSTSNESQFEGAPAEVDGKMYMCPSASGVVGVIDLSDDSFSAVSPAAAEAVSYSGQAAYGQKVYCVPRTGAGGVGVFDVTFETLTNVPFAVDFATENATDLFSGGVVVGTKVYFSPDNAQAIGVFDVLDDTFYTIRVPELEAFGRGHNYAEAVAIDDLVYFTPRSQNSVLVLHPTTEQYAFINSNLPYLAEDDAGHYYGKAAVVGRNLYFAPAKEAGVGVLG